MWQLSVRSAGSILISTSFQRTWWSTGSLIKCSAVTLSRSPGPAPGPLRAPPLHILPPAALTVFLLTNSPWCRGWGGIPLLPGLQLRSLSRPHVQVSALTGELVFEVGGFVLMIFRSLHIQLKLGTFTSDSGLALTIEPKIYICHHGHSWWYHLRLQLNLAKDSDTKPPTHNTSPIVLY